MVLGGGLVSPQCFGMHVKRDTDCISIFEFGFNSLTTTSAEKVKIDCAPTDNQGKVNDDK